jgi:hypothetical protein
MSDKSAIAAAKAHQAIMDMAGAFRESGREDERERIIALLNRECFCDLINPYREMSCDACEYVALIKGENK